MGVDEEGYLLFVLLEAVFDAEKAVVNVLLEGDELTVDGVAFEQVVAKDAGCPSAKGCGIEAVDAITNGNYCIKVVEPGLILLFAIITHVFQNGTCAILGQFTTLVYI